MSQRRSLNIAVGTAVTPPPTLLRGLARRGGLRRGLSPCRTDERGLSQSTENVILLVGAVAVAVIVIRIVTDFVNNNLALIGHG